MEIVENLIKISENIPENVSLIAVSKTKSKNLIELAYNHGQRDFGENKVQELVEKYNSLQKDINWHMIGHLQRNKVKQIAPFVYLIHSVDSYRLLIEINKQGFKNGRIINVLVQIDISKDNTKFGFTYAEFDELIKLNKLKDLKNIRAMASFIDRKSKKLLCKRNETIHLDFANLDAAGYLENPISIMGVLCQEFTNSAY